ncbi:unnamed protein product [Didymodactylos carnosus]|uniref:RING-type domain-containing protein n=1 Tax=Didymodactylos carnosus TaxID=1234261 RepID=A0A815BWW5_9BILA|nr:unnamed protein product [Didymodactylos carnosus]CAF4073031.1 unnamed protein product [Didymodactylos carnosus]
MTSDSKQETKCSSPICLDPLIDPYTHTSCDNSFCNKCIKKLRTCPFCRSTILNSTNLKMTNRALRNILDELAVQCNVCKQILQRGDFSYHCKENCLPRSFITHHQEEEIAAMSEICKTTLGDRESGLTRDEYDQHLSNVYRRIHKLETELFELKKAIYFCIFVIACLLTIIFFDEKKSTSNNQGETRSSGKLDKSGSTAEKQQQKGSTKSKRDHQDTDQPGVTPRDWQSGQKPIGNDPKYGTGASNEPNPGKTT